MAAQSSHLETQSVTRPVKLLVLQLVLETSRLTMIFCDALREGSEDAKFPAVVTHVHQDLS